MGDFLELLLKLSPLIFFPVIFLWLVGTVIKRKRLQDNRSKETLRRESYPSKDAIYKDFPIALKFGLQGVAVYKEYESFQEALSDHCQAKFRRFHREREGLAGIFPDFSVGFFVEVPVKGYRGQRIGTEFILLHHESGWEWFLSAGTAIQLLIPVVTFMKNNWSKYVGVGIDYVEIRSKKKKGVVRIRFSDFKMAQIKCLLKNFDTIDKLWDSNKKCFGGRLFPPPRSPKE